MKRKQRNWLSYSEEKAHAIANEIADQIKRGELKSGDYIPNTKELIAKYKVGSHTAIRMREILVNKLLIEQPVRGRGIRVL